MFVLKNEKLSYNIDTKKCIKLIQRRLFTFKCILTVIHCLFHFYIFNLNKTKRIETSEHVIKNVIRIRYKYPMYYYV